MELNWQNMKKIMAIVAFGIVLYISLQNFDEIGAGIGNFINVISPFILGACIAFVVNIPMKFFEKKIFKVNYKNKVVRGVKNTNQRQVELKNDFANIIDYDTSNLSNIGTQQNSRYNVIKNEERNIKSNFVKAKEKPINKTKRFISIFLSLFIIIFVLVLLMTLVIPEIANVIKTFIQYLTGLPAELKPIIDEAASTYPEFGEELSELQIDFSNILNTLIDFLKNAGTSLIDFVGKTISTTISSIVNLVVGVIFSFYLLMSKEKIGKNFKRIVLAYLPNKYANKILEITELSKEAFTKFITGQLKEAVILGTLCYIGMIILQLPYSLTISLLAMVTALIPIFGAFIGATVGVILLLAVSPFKAIIFLIFIIVLQQLETNLIYPKVVGDSVGLPGIIVLVAISIGGSLGGVLGMLVALPIASVTYTLIRAGVEKRLKEKNINYL